MSNALANIAGVLANSDLFKDLQGVNDKLAGGGSSNRRRISIKGSKFTKMVGGDKVGNAVHGDINIVVLDAGPISKTYYEGVYDPKAEAKPPVCWSSDTKTPDEKVPVEQRQAAKCADCPKAIKGSGQGNSAACRYNQRLAVALEGDLENVYQLQLPATSVFGDAENGHTPMQAYVRHLNAHKVPVIAVYTNMYFDENAESPKLFFKAVRPLEEAELQQVVELRDTDAVKEAVTLTVSQTDGVQPTPETVVAPPKQERTKAKSKPKKDEVDDEPVEEPVKVTSKAKKAEAEAPEEIADIIDDWDD